MWRPGWIGSPRRPAGETSPTRQRDRIAALLALVTAVCLAGTFVVSKGTQFLMPGPLTSAHGAIETCSACHSNSGNGKLSWVGGLMNGHALSDSKACLTCHKMPDTAFNAHGASDDVLKQSTGRLTKVAAETVVPQSARVQNAAFPARDVAAGGLTCATCHQEHQGSTFKLNRISNEQCRSCHVVQFDSFDGQHPKFEGYPFKTRTRIIYDHAGHFGKHYPELAKKDPAKRIPDTCSSCHNSGEDKRVMAVAPFERTCSGCHLDQITGKERATGPKGIAFLSLPGLDLATLKQKSAAIGEWPDASDAPLTPFMKVMIARTERGRALLARVDRLNLQDLVAANDNQIKAVTDLAWEVKALFHALIKGKASDVLGDLNIAGGAKLNAGLVADLTASLPRDVVVSAQQQWLPNLASEIANRPAAGQKQSSAGPEATGTTRPQAPTGGSKTTDALRPKIEGSTQSRPASGLPPAMRAGIRFAENAAKPDRAAGDGGEDELSIDEHGDAVKGRLLLPSGTPRAIGARNKKGKPEAADEKNAKPASSKPEAGKVTPANTAPPDTKAGGSDAPKAAADGGKQPDKPGDQSDDLLFPTEAEVREMKAGGSTGETAARPDNAAVNTERATAKPDSTAPPTADTNAPAQSAAISPARGAPEISIGSDIDPESWAEYGGWYRQDFAIFYRPTGHKDKFIYSWLFLTGPQAPRNDRSPAAMVFEALTNKDAQGSCTKCHSVDDIPGKGRMVNFTPASVASKQGRFTKFIHEPHFGIMENRGCLTCHSLEKGRPYLKGYEQGNPQSFSSDFGEVKKELCQTCHTSGKARQDCLLCHSYHVNGAITPIMSTKLPSQ